MNTVTVSFAVPAKIYENVAKRAGPLNIRPAEYARRLFEAAWTARVAGERGMPTDDRALDHQVRQVFLLADCEPEYVADALKLPLDRVKRILEGWRQVARELIDPKPEPETPRGGAAEDIPPAGDGKGYDAALIGKMWAEGISGKDIAAAIGKTEAAFSMWAGKHRDICPRRR